MKKFPLFLLIVFFSLAPIRILLAEEVDSRQKLISIIEKSNRFYASVKNYTAIFLKQEMAKGKLGDTERIFLKFEKPFKIFMGWLNTEKKGLQVVYQRGRHDGKLAIHKPGLGLGLLPVVFLDQKSPWVREGSEAYDIEDAGIGTFLEDFTEAVKRGDAAGQLKVEFVPSESAGEEMADVTFEGSKEDSGYFAYKVRVSFDPATSLPVKMKLYDWKDRMTGDYAYENLKIDLAPEDSEFKKQINRSLYRVYQAK